jgi:hypothetical protein
MHAIAPVHGLKIFSTRPTLPAQPTTRMRLLEDSARWSAEQVERYLDFGYRTFIRDTPASRDELDHTSVVFERATRGLAV